LSIYDEIESDLTTFLQDIKDNHSIDTLFLTGVNAGGSVASHAYLKIKAQKLFRNTRITVFDPIRVGNDKWDSHYNQIAFNETRRYVT